MNDNLPKPSEELTEELNKIIDEDDAKAKDIMLQMLWTAKISMEEQSKEKMDAWLHQFMRDDLDEITRSVIEMINNYDNNFDCRKCSKRLPHAVFDLRGLCQGCWDEETGGV